MSVSHTNIVNYRPYMRASRWQKLPPVILLLSTPMQTAWQVWSSPYHRPKRSMSWSSQRCPKQQIMTSPIYHLKSNSSSVAEPSQPIIDSLFTKAGGVRDEKNKAAKQERFCSRPHHLGSKSWKIPAYFTNHPNREWGVRECVLFCIPRHWSCGWR